MGWSSCVFDVPHYEYGFFWGVSSLCCESRIRKNAFLLQSPFVCPSAMSGASPGATGVLEWSEDGAVEVFLRCTATAHTSTAHSANIATELFVNQSTDTKTHRDEGVSISEDRRARRLQSNTIEAIANVLRREDAAAVEISDELVSMANASVFEVQDASAASEIWMDSITILGCVGQWVQQPTSQPIEARQRRNWPPERGEIPTCVPEHPVLSRSVREQRAGVFNLATIVVLKATHDCSCHRRRCGGPASHVRPSASGAHRGERGGACGDEAPAGMWAGAWRGGNAHAPTAARPRGHVQRPRIPGTLNASGVVGAS